MRPMSNRTGWDETPQLRWSVDGCRWLLEELSAQQRITPIDRLLGTPMGSSFGHVFFFTDENPVLPPFDALDEATWGPLNVAKEYQHVWELHKEFANRAIPARNIDWFLQETASEATPFFHVFSEAVVGWIWYDDLVDGATEKALWTKAGSLALMISSAQKTSIFSTSYSQGYLKGGRLVMM